MLTEPWTLLLIFLGGLAGSGHCLGMCGGFALTLGLTPGDLARRTTRQVIYGLGRTFTYVALGVVVGAGARRLEFSLPSLSQLQGWLGLVAGVLLVWQALATFGWRVWPRQFEPGCLLPGMFGELMRSARGTHVFLGGMVNGLLPCGLVWSYLALAASSLHPVDAGVVMGLFGLGTLPALAGLGTLGGWVPAARQMSLRRIGAWCLILTGLLTLLRGGLALSADPAHDPGCHPSVPRVVVTR